MNKKCTVCGIEKSLDLYHRSNKTKDGKMSNCAECNKEKSRKYHHENKVCISEKQKAYRNNNKEYFLIKNKEWRAKTGYAKKYQQERIKNDLFFRFKNRLRTLLRNAITKQGYTKKSKSFEILGCDYDTFITHIQYMFTEGMTWENHGQWHIDHIIPLSKAKTEEEVIKLNHYTNLQPLWAKDNLKKSNKHTETYNPTEPI